MGHAFQKRELDRGADKSKGVFMTASRIYKAGGNFDQLL